MKGGLTELLRLEPPEGTVVVSFDVFDTLVQRRIDPPEKVKEWVCRTFLRRYPLQESVDGFVARRMQIERTIEAERRRRGLDPEVSLPDVIDRLAAHYAKGADFRKQFLQVELEVEKCLLVPVRELIPLLERLSLRFRLVAVSDTYLPESILRELLDAVGLSRYFTSVYCSCDHGVSKGSGRLFPVVAGKEQIGLSQLFHVGDNFLSDYFRPRSGGVRAFLYLDAENQRRRKLLTSVGRREGDDFWRGYSFLLRLEEGARPPDPAQSLLYFWGRRVVGPLLACFTHQLVVELSNSRHDALFFIAREGFLLKKLYELFVPRLSSNGGGTATASYLCVSRYTAFRAALSQPGDWSADVATVDFMPQLNEVLNRFGFPDDEIPEILSRFGLIAPLQPGEGVRETIRHLLEIPEFIDLVRGRASEPREELEHYLAEHGFFSAKRVALVDVGWYGTIQDLLERCFADRRDMPEVEGVYLALKRSHTGVSPERKRGLVHDFRRPVPELETLTFFRESFEFSSRALHGTTTGYRRENGRSVPQFRVDARERKMHAGIREIQRGVLDCARDYLALQEVDPVEPHLLMPVAALVYDRRIGFPTTELAKAFDGLINTDDFGTDRLKPLVTSMAASDIVNPRAVRRILIETPWREAALCKSRLPVVWLFNGVRRILAWKRMKENLA
ncbi:hypothetical protein [Geobacter anodireducens]|uniref:Haloacid dehalogenase n=1 Tax=Geobacter soli TaxID=1510391 RepID=A0A0C1QWI2_9BACT|nr:hypothetical protein [Geobacter soli]KIE42501.1 hypothetical protein SE37_07600 [Geobacter soli]